MKQHCFICDKGLDKEHWSHTVKAIKTELEEPDANYELCDVCSAKVSTFIVRAKYSSDKYKL
jgi:hypothetical protein